MSLLPIMPAVPPIVWSIAGSDPCGGAGIQADLKTFAALGVHGATVVTALTAQNSFAVTAVQPVDANMVGMQLATLAADMKPRAIKIGLIGSVEIAQVVAQYLAENPIYVVCDPVMVASSGTALMTDDVLPAMIENLFPHVDLLTPNLSEAARLWGKPIDNVQAVEAAASYIKSLGVRAVVIKGWRDDRGFAQDFYTGVEKSFWLTAPWQEGIEARGTGCSFAAAYAAAYALGLPESDALVIAKAYVSQALRAAVPVGKGAKILAHKSWPPGPEDLPWITRQAAEAIDRPRFADIGPQPLGFYPIVDSVAWLEKLLPLGVRTAQLRIKDRGESALDSEIGSAIHLARRYDCRLFINDYWRAALKHGAYGVHLGQEDLEDADIPALAASGLRLGISTHCYEEVARAHALRPSYIAIGPIFPTTLKAMKFAPQGIAALALWRRLLDYPLVAIGGITIEHAAALRAAGADGISIVSDVTKAADPEARAAQWLRIAA